MSILAKIRDKKLQGGVIYDPPPARIGLMILSYHFHGLRPGVSINSSYLNICNVIDAFLLTSLRFNGFGY